MRNFFAHSVRQWFIQHPRSIKRIISLCVDVIVIILVLWLAFSLRYSEFYVPSPEQLWVFLLAPVLAIPIFIQFGLYRAIIRYIGIEALWAIVKAVTLYTLIFATIILLAGPLAGVVPRTVYGINALILILFTGGSRLLARWWLSDVFTQNQESITSERVSRPILIYGAGASGVRLAESLKVSHQQKPVAFIDDAKQLQNQQINGLVIYSPEKLTYLIEKFAVRDVLLAMPSVSRNRRNEVIRLLEPFPVHVRTLPDLSDLAEGKITVSDIREVDIADLLGREQVESIPDLLHANITGKSVMVTGAGGSIGSELCRQIVLLQPTQLILFEMNEFNLYAIEKIEYQNYL